MTTTQSALRSGTWTAQTDRSTAAFRVRKLGLLRVRGTFDVVDGLVTVVHGRPVAAPAPRSPAAVRPGLRNRARAHAGPRFLRAEDHPHLVVRVDDLAPADRGWTGRAVVEVAGGRAPVDLVATREDEQTVHVTGVLDRTATPIRAPRWLIGRRVEIDVRAVLSAPA